MALDFAKAASIAEACDLIRRTSEDDAKHCLTGSPERNLYAAVATLAGMLGELAEDLADG